MKTQLLIFLLLITSLSSQSQTKQVDSLISVLSDTKSQTEKLALLNAISKAYTATGNIDEIKNYANKAVTLAKELNANTQLGNAYVNLGNANIISGNYDASVAYFTNAKSVFEIEYIKQPTQDLKKSLARAYGSIGIVSSEQSNYSRAFQYYIKSISIYEELQDTNMLSKLYNNVGVAYQSQAEYIKALDYFNKAKTSQIELKDPNIGITLTNMANCHIELKNLPKAILVFNEAEKHVQQNPRALGEWNNSIGAYYNKINNQQQSIKHWDQAIKAFNSIDDKFGIADTYIFKSELFLEQKNYQQAIKNAALALQLTTQTNVLEQQRNAQQLLSKTYEKQNKLPQALKHYKLFTTLNDSLSNTENIRKGVQAEMNFEYEKKENIERLEREKQEVMAKEAQSKRTITIVSIALISIMALAFSFLYYNRKQLKQRLTLEKEVAEYEQKALHLQMNPHFIFNCLGAISGFIINNGTDHAIKYLSKFSKLMRLTLEYSKESLIPLDKEVESLQNYLELEKLRFNNVFEFTISKDDTIEDDVAIPPLLIQPLIENAIIHGVVPKKAGNISVNFRTEDQSVICEITDNGVGIDNSIASKKESVQIHKSMALDIIKKRLKMITDVSNKKANMTSFQKSDANGKSEGTKVVITLPIQYID